MKTTMCCPFHDAGGSPDLGCGGDLPNEGGKHLRDCAYHGGGDCTCGRDGSQARHTRGPWEFSIDERPWPKGGRPQLHVFCPTGPDDALAICSMPLPPSDTPPWKPGAERAEAVANARLLAAAPDLLIAAQGAAHALRIALLSDKKWALGQAAHELLLEAIEKATGEKLD